ncbi:MAG: 50S ribosomal protein L5 [Candidatus Roizmanbacteria bacterium GW2011_GWA2_35_8]|uniref:Large ribosomal subunit protein uL5 n=1 Tax=Candidatus Roizmanbacteria bacterium GW2011_GWA2_35_8 TaxID=1618479 RepID=A0A0G0D025_9BACT|nr:MAG: 50S ribosomal protein L5 [Candidatus Roizmanbacteria bacterium GW2011_GWA2_35_8]
MTFKEFYNQDIKKKLIDELKLINSMEAPMPIKIVINVGAGEAVTNKNVIEKIQEQIGLISGQKPIITKARNSISAFKIRKGLPIGVKVTLRGTMMWNFLEKLVKIVIPRLRDFKGLNKRNVDNHGNLNIGFYEQTIFPEIEFDKVDKIRGLEVTVVTNARDHDKGHKLFEILGVPFKKS